MSPEEVLHALRLYGQMDSDQPFSVGDVEQIRMATPIREFDMVSSGNLAFDLAGFFFPPAPIRTNYGRSMDALTERTLEMESILSGVSTVGELCRELANRVRLTPIQECKFLDQQCAAGSIFLTLKRRLSERGMNVKKLAPSAHLPFRGFDYAKYCMVIQEAALIAPSRVPLSEAIPAVMLLGLGKLLCCLAIPLFLLLAILDINARGIILAIIATPLLIMPGLFLLALFHRSNPLPGIDTYRNLCKVLAGEPVARGHTQNQGADAPRSPTRDP